MTMSVPGGGWGKFGPHAACRSEIKDLKAKFAAALHCIEAGHDYGEEPDCSRCGHYGPEDREAETLRRLATAEKLERELKARIERQQAALTESEERAEKAEQYGREYIGRTDVHQERLAEENGELRVELEECRRERDELMTIHESCYPGMVQLCAERDAALADNRALREALEGVAPERCLCSEDQLTEACGCGFVLARDALEAADPTAVDVKAIEPAVEPTGEDDA